MKDVGKATAPLRITEDPRSDTRSREGSRLLAFFSLVFVLSIPFWLLGGGRLPLPMNLSASALMFVCPFVAAAILAFTDEGRRGIVRLLKRALDYETIKNKAWYLPIVFVLPVVYSLSYGVMRLKGRQLPEPDIPVLAIPIFLVVFFIAAIGEEVGYMGYAADRMQRRWSALASAVILGAVWGLLHVIPDIQNGHGVAWIASQRAVYSVALRVLIMWIYNNTGGSVFAAILFHDTDNASVSLFPNGGSHYDPAVTGVIAAMAAAFVTFLWGAKTLARYRYRADERRVAR